MEIENIEEFDPERLWMEIRIVASQVSRMHSTVDMVDLDHASTELAHLIKLFDDYIQFDGGEIKYTEDGRAASHEVEEEIEESLQESIQEMTESMIVSAENLPFSTEDTTNNGLVELLFSVCEFIESLDDCEEAFNSALIDPIAGEYKQAFRTKLTEVRDNYNNRHVRRPNIKYLCASCKQEVDVANFKNHRCDDYLNNVEDK